MLIDALKEIVGPKGWISNPDLLEPYLSERRGRIKGHTLIMVSPASTDEVAAVVSECSAAGVGVVPQGGNTGLCGGAIPDDKGDEVLLSLTRMNRIRALDADDYSMIAEAGCVLSDVQQAAEKAGRFFPLSLSAEGSCQIGGNLSTNAGGINVIRYGTARQQVLGLEVVLADGTVWDGLRTVRKDTAGYDLKQLFIGSEGTLGIITAAALRLWPRPGNSATLLAALDTPEAAVDLLGRLHDAVGDSVQAFELMSDRCIRYAQRHVPDVTMPIAGQHKWYVLTEVVVGANPAVLEEAAMTALGEKVVEDAVVAKNQAESDRLWRMRHSISDAQKPEGASLKHDISVPTGRIGEFIRKGNRLVSDLLPGARLVIFGHVGDGNLHYNVSQPAGADAEEFLADGQRATEAIYDLAIELGGSFSAEHGVGIFKKSYLEQYRGGAELRVMRALKSALDPENTLNPGKVI
ncbi:MAG: FAD-binding protein [Woeseiaceae bacterium]|nr:FAD-binding protein [Woeseiaceae bacterium]NIP20328.1 FAD-binding protein [Woeseiaceae bacterium]NIS89218.1 FAD-binding protein [Woeseiaceae bacterium]